MPPESRNYWWLNANPAIWSYSDLAPGEENNYTQYNESGSLRQVPKYFLEVHPGDLVLGYATSPQKELVCLCEITRPLENGAFHFKKLFDFPNPVPSTAWTSDPLLSYFHFQGSLFKVSQEQWDGFVGLVKERNPGIAIPRRACLSIGQLRIWKISHGSQEFHAAQRVLSELSSQHLITMNRYTGRGQGEKFESEMRTGDYFYLRENGKIKLFGQIESSAEYTPLAVNRLFANHNGDWIARKYRVLFTSISQKPYTGPTKAWTPNYNSTLAQVPLQDLEDFERLILLPFFGKKLTDISDDTVSAPIPSPEKATESMMKHPLNTILYGPPGTGKTHNIVNHVLSIIDAQSLPETQTPSQYATAKARFDELTQQGRIAFVTFHQSYGYEDFIEGIRPNTDLLKETESGNIQYKIEEGIFRKFCARATENWEASRKSGEELSSGEQAKKCIADLLNEELSKDSTEARRRFQTLTGTAFFIESANETHIRIALPDNPSWRMVVLSRAELMAVIAAGRAFTGPKEIHDFLGKNAARAHDSYLFALYTELRPHMAAAHAEPAVVPELPFVFVIDEINRGNISKIFGELITLIEPTKRLGAAEATKAILPYSGDEFGVPPNVYILGTMNTADRSIALLDTALRRRFDFVEMMPKPDLLSDLKPDGIDLKQMLETINNRIEFLLDREHTIGHAYFLGDFAAHPTLEGLAAIFRKRVVPLLQEYFFEDYAKIRLVLGDASIKKNTPEFQFVLEEKGQAQELFPGVPADFGGPVNADHVLYQINDTAFDKAKSYTGIYT